LRVCYLNRGINEEDISTATKSNTIYGPKVHPIPEGYHTVTPFVNEKGAALLIDFMKEAFNAVEMGRVTVENGTIGHAEVRIGDSVVMMFDSKE
jgi:hypothetical protein